MGDAAPEAESCAAEPAGRDAGAIARAFAGPLARGAASDERAQVATLLIMYLLVFLFGRSANRAMATRWLRMTAPVLRAQFSSLGCDAAPAAGLTDEQLASPVANKLLYAESARNFKLYASGRRFCTGLLVELDLKPRQDLLSLIYSLFYVWEDTLLVDVPMNATDMDPFVFTVVRKVDLGFVKKTMLDVAFFTRSVPLELLPGSLCLLTDCSELVPHLLPPQIVKLLAYFEDAIEMIHFSDQNTRSGFGPNHVPAKALRFRFRKPSSEKDNQVLVDLAMQFVDLVGRTRLSPQARRAAIRKRARARSGAHKASRSPEARHRRRRAGRGSGSKSSGTAEAAASDAVTSRGGIAASNQQEGEGVQ